MLSKLLKFIRDYDLIAPGDRVTVAFSGGKDSLALLFAFYLLKDKLEITLEAAHFNHKLRGQESDADEAEAKRFCDSFEIPIHIGSVQVEPGKKGLEAAARDARYAWLKTLPGKIATAHTADDNAETVLLHMLRGTGLKGLGGIPPVNGALIRPMLLITKEDVEDFLSEWCLHRREDSSNRTDDFQRNRIRHHVMPLLYQENPKAALTLSRMALGLRFDEEYLASQAEFDTLPDVQTLGAMPRALRVRMLARFLTQSGVREPEQIHIRQAEQLIDSPNPSARIHLPGGVTIARRYDRLEVLKAQEALEPQVLPVPGEVKLPGYTVTAWEARELINTPDTFTVVPRGTLILRPRHSGDAIRLPGGTRSLKKLFIDRKIPAAQRDQIPVLCDDGGILGVYTIGTDTGRLPEGLPGVTVHIEKMGE